MKRCQDAIAGKNLQDNIFIVGCDHSGKMTLFKQFKLLSNIINDDKYNNHNIPFFNDNFKLENINDKDNDGAKQVNYIYNTQLSLINTILERFLFNLIEYSKRNDNNFESKLKLNYPEFYNFFSNDYLDLKQYLQYFEHHEMYQIQLYNKQNLDFK